MEEYDRRDGEMCERIESITVCLRIDLFDLESLAITANVSV